MNNTWIKMDRRSIEHQSAVADIWNDACSEDLSLSPEVVAYNLQPGPNGKQIGWLIFSDDEAVAFISASVADVAGEMDQINEGWLDALAVKPPFQHQGLGSKLLEKAESWLITEDSSMVHLGCSFHPFVAGLPTTLDSDDFFKRYGFRPRAGSPNVWDVAANLGEYRPSAVTGDCEVRPARPDDEDRLRAFLESEFPGRWAAMARTYLDNGGRIADFMLLWTESGVDGFCQLTFEDSLRPIARHYPFRLPRPWGQLGPIGVSALKHGRGYGTALMNASLRRLHDNGVNGCVIDWTTITGFYAKFGFQKFREYRQLTKVLASR